jgi:hypothetical protein
MAKSDANAKTGGDQNQPSSPDLTASNPSSIDAPERTGGPTSAGSTTADREAQTDLRPLDSPSPSTRAEEEVQSAVEAAMHTEYVQKEAARRVNAERAKRLMDSVNTENPYGLKPGEKPVYQVGNFLCDPDGTRIQKVSDMRPPQRNAVIDPSTSMKQM